MSNVVPFPVRTPASGVVLADEEEDDSAREDDWAPRRSILEEPDDEDADVAACGFVWSIYDRGVRERDAMARGERYVWRGHFLDKRRMRALEVLPGFKAEHGRGPTLRELAALLDIDGKTDDSSTVAAGQVVSALKEIGAVTHTRATGVLLVEDVGSAASGIDAELDAGAKALAKVDAALDRATAELALIEEPTPQPTRGATADVMRGVRRALGQRVAKQIVTTLNEEKSMPSTTNISEKQRAILDAYNANPSPNAVAEELGTTAANVSTVIGRLRKMGVVNPAPHQGPKPGTPTRPTVKAAPPAAAHVARAPRPQALEEQDPILVQLCERRDALKAKLAAIDGAIAALGGGA